MSENMNEIVKNHIFVIDKIKNSVVSSDKSVNLIVVSKTHGIEKIFPLLDYGYRIFGENKVQEAKQKWSDLKKKYDNIELHLIGHLQTNKVADAIELFDVIHTIDRPKLAEKISAEQKKQNKTVKCFIQINTGEEKQKSGVYPKEAIKFIDYCITDLNLNVIGLMCIPPVNEPAVLHFGLLRKIVENNNLMELSMGMSNDYELAVSMGATYVRVGSAIFGQRSIKNSSKELFPFDGNGTYTNYL